MYTNERCSYLCVISITNLALWVQKESMILPTCLPKTLLLKLGRTLREEHRLQEGCLRTNMGGLRERQEWEGSENCIMGRFIICTLYQIWQGNEIKGDM